MMMIIIPVITQNWQQNTPSSTGQTFPASYTVSARSPCFESPLPPHRRLLLRRQSWMSARLLSLQARPTPAFTYKAQNYDSPPAPLSNGLPGAIRSRHIDHLVRRALSTLLSLSILPTATRLPKSILGAKQNCSVRPATPRDGLLGATLMRTVLPL